MEPGSSDRFGFEWSRYSDIYPEHETQFRGWTAPLGPADWRGQTFLDAGCGMGRNSFWPMRYGADSGVALDLDERSLERARHNLAAYPQVEIRKQSIYEISDRDRFDIAFSIGVIHHLDDPARALRAMVAAVKAGGRVLIWVYGQENNGWSRWLDPVREHFLTRIPVAWVHALSLLPTLALFTGLRLGFGRNPYLKLLRRVRFRHLRSIVFDQMIPRIAHYWPREAVERLMQQAGLVEIRLTWVNEVSWSALGRKPSAPAASSKMDILS